MKFNFIFKISNRGICISLVPRAGKGNCAVRLVSRCGSRTLKLQTR